MAKVLLVYGTTEGQTAKIAQHVGDVARRMGHEVDVVHGATLDADHDASSYDAIVVGASLHEGRHQRYVVDWVKSHLGALARVPSAFFQVSLTSTIRDPEHDRDAAACVEKMTEETGWKPAQVGYFAGALRYTQYSWMKRFVLRSISKSQGGDTDTSRDFEYTDWADVERWAREVLGALPRRAAATSPARAG